MIALGKASSEYEPKEAREMILAGNVRGGMVVQGTLDLSGQRDLTTLPNGLKCFELDASGTSISRIPDDIQVECGITLQDCLKISRLPDRLQTGTLNLRGCTTIKELPEGLNVWFLDVGGCTSLRTFPKKATIANGNLNVSGCTSLDGLPNYLTKLATLDISDCPQIDSLPSKLRVGLWIDVGGSGLSSLPKTVAKTGVRWRGVAIDQRIAFRPEELTAAETLKEANTERRRVMIERMGTDRFMREANAKRIDKDTDPGGPRELLRLPLKDDEDIVSLSCYCPSTGRHYLLRVPPDTKTCHQAAAWIAGFDDPAKYKPVMET